MGQTESVFSEKEMDDFEALTFLNRTEIQLVFNKFENLDYDNVSEDKDCELPMEVIQQLPELKVNPFRDRICQIFSSSGTGGMTFVDFLDMFSVFNDKCPLQVKLEYAFRIYDFDNDRIIQRDDIEKTILCLTKANGLQDEDQLNEEEMEFLIDKIMEEADTDAEAGICFQEFAALMKQKPDFLVYFLMRI